MTTKTLYYIENCGCDDTTQGLIRLTDEEFKKFETFIKNLNKNSTYGCMPAIQVYKIDENQIIECTYKDDSYYDNNGNSIGRGELMYLDDKVYIIDKGFKWEIVNTRQVI